MVLQEVGLLVNRSGWLQIYLIVFFPHHFVYEFTEVSIHQSVKWLVFFKQSIYLFSGVARVFVTRRKKLNFAPPLCENQCPVTYFWLPFGINFWLFLLVPLQQTFEVNAPIGCFQLPRTNNFQNKMKTNSKYQKKNSQKVSNCFSQLNAFPY